MAPPRASRLASRKSLIPDPSLYSSFTSDSENGSPPRAASRSKPLHSSSQSHGESIGGAGGAGGGKKRSTRPSLDSQEGDLSAGSLKGSRGKSSSNGVNGVKVSAKTASGKARGKAADESGSEPERDEPSRSSRAGAGQADKGVKRQKTGPSSQESQGASQADGARKAFVPRAAARAAASSKASSSFGSRLGEPDDSETIAFSTLPPTPNDAAKKRAAAQSKENPRGKAPRRGDHSPTRTTGDGMTGVYQAAIDTPKNKQNKSYREGIPATPGTTAAPRSARRTSTENRGKRASGIGGGFEAVPHRNIPNDKLYRHAGSAELPLAHRMRSVLSFAAQRQRDSLYSSSTSANDPYRDVVSNFIDGIIQSRVDVSVRPRATGANGDLLAHPQNVANRQKMKELEAAYAAISLEQEDRDKVAARYDGLQQRRELQRAQSQRAAQIGTEGEIVIPSGMSGGPSSLEEALRLGRQLLSGAAKGSSKPEPVEEDRETVEVRLKIAAFKQATHRFSSFAHLANSYVATRTAQTADALRVESERGLATSSTSAPQDTKSGEPTERRTLASAAVRSRREGAKRALDPRELLRAISGADVRSRGVAA